VDMKLTGGPEGRGWTGDVKVMQLDVSKMESLGWRPKGNSEYAVRRAARELVKELRRSSRRRLAVPARLAEGYVGLNYRGPDVIQSGISTERLEFAIAGNVLSNYHTSVTGLALPNEVALVGLLLYAKYHEGLEQGERSPC
ncbi:MAG: hypothetical protein ACP5LG_06090, partial [Conexivisphaera sp.]